MILIEGLPGSGKTSLAGYAQEIPQRSGITAEWFLEEHPDHPVFPREVRREQVRSDFPELCLERWRSFAAECARSERIVILEGCAFQTTVRFMFANGLSLDRISAYYAEFEQTIAPLSPRLIYLFQADPGSFLREETMARRGPDWTRKVADYTTATPYARERGLSGLGGFISFWTEYGSLCDKLVEISALPRICIENSDQDWKAIRFRTRSWLEVE